MLKWALLGSRVLRFVKRCGSSGWIMSRGLSNRRVILMKMSNNEPRSARDRNQVFGHTWGERNFPSVAPFAGHSHGNSSEESISRIIQVTTAAPMWDSKCMMANTKSRGGGVSLKDQRNIKGMRGVEILRCAVSRAKIEFLDTILH